MSSLTAFKPGLMLTFATVQESLIRLRLHAKSNHEDSLYLDLSETTHCDSAGLALLIEAKRLSILCGQQLMIKGMSSKIQMLAEFCGVLALLLENNED